ncbi:MAG: Gldg family protein, partial [Gemmataceae bacterium]
MSITQTPSSTGDVFERLAPKRERIAYGLIGLGLALLAIPVTNLSLYRLGSLVFLTWGAALSLLVLGVGLYYLLMEPARTLRAEADRLRILTLVVLGGAGLLAALLGLVLPFCTRPFTITDYGSIFAGGVRKWRERENVGPLIRCAAALIGGLVLMFLGLIQARAFERTSPNLRRLLYGYNAVLSSLLLILIMVLVNLLPYAGVWPFSYANEAIDWTRTGLHSMHEATINVVAGLKQPVKVYALGSSGDPIMTDMTDMLERCRSLNPQYFSWEQLSRDRNLTDVRDLIRKYNVADSQGVLVVYGNENKEISEFIRRKDLYKDTSVGRSPRYEFKGENVLLNALTYLSADRSRATVYFTQGNGELDFKDRGANEVDGGMGQLMEELGRINYETRELNVAAATDKVPDDADIVVVARPAQTVPEKFVKALRDYLHGTGRKDGKKGKLIVLFDVVIESGKGTMVRTGLEKLVNEYGVRVNDNQLVAVRPTLRDYLLIQGVPPWRGSNALAKAFANEKAGTRSLFVFYKARTVESSRRSPPGAPPSNQPDPLILPLADQLCVVQKDLSARPSALMTELHRNPNQIPELLNRSPLALAIAEGKTPAPFPGHEFAAKEGQPRLLVFGDASWISNG